MAFTNNPSGKCKICGEAAKKRLARGNQYNATCGSSKCVTKMKSVSGAKGARKSFWGNYQ